MIVLFAEIIVIQNWIVSKICINKKINSLQFTIGIFVTLFFRKFIFYCFTVYAVLNLLVLLETGMLNIHDSTQLP